jgi:hypothetical protein
MAQSPPLDPSIGAGQDPCPGSAEEAGRDVERAGFASLPLSLAMQLEKACGRFEAAWQAAGTAGRPNPEDYLASAPTEGRQALLRELFRIDLAYRRQAGDFLDPVEYQQRFPGLERSWILNALASATATLSIAEFSAKSATPKTATPDCVSAPIPSVTPTPVSMPDRFDDYELLGEIARGGMGVVYKARQLSLNRVVALKMIREHVILTDEAVQRFHREARAVAALDHPNIVAVHSSGQYEGRPYYAMAYVEGDNLQQAVRRDGLPAPQRAAALVGAIAEAVDFAHQHGIIHRDLKPVNVLIDRQGRPRVTDFGLAYQPEAMFAGDRLTQTGQVLGTPSYMSPEQAMSKHEAIGPATDVYSLGGILYFLLTGQPPFQGQSLTEVLCQVVMQPPAPPRQVNPRAPAELEAICLRCLEKDPAMRYPSAGALAEALEAAAAGAEAPAAGTLTRLPAARAPSRRKWVGPVIVALLGIAAGLWLTAPYWWTWAQTVIDIRPKGPPTLKPPAPEELRKDFGLEVVMIDGKSRLPLQRDSDGLFRLRKGDEVKFRIKAAANAYVGVWAIDADGTTIHELFPNEKEKEHRFSESKEYVVPNWRVDAVETDGPDSDWVWVIASTLPWDPVEGELEGPLRVYNSIRERERWAERQRGFRRAGVGTLAEAVLKFRVEPR